MIPQSYRRLVATQPSRDFRRAVEIIELDFPTPAADEIVIHNHYAGVNASDLNISAGVYFTGSEPPFDMGVESIGEVVAVGSGVAHFKVGDFALSTKLGGGYSEYTRINAAMAIPVPAATPEIMGVAISGLTASVGLFVAGEMQSNETVLITAAAGGAGHFAVQLAKQAGNHVIGTTSSAAKAQLLHELGCDRVINYHAENVREVLKNEYPRGINLVFEGVGGDLFEACVENLAVRGRLITLGFISEYRTGPQAVTQPRIYHQVLWKSSTVRGFLFSDYVEHIPHHLQQVFEAYFAGNLRAEVDPTPFVGLEAIPDAVDYMHAGKNQGKVVIRFV